jgi:hypothetical protein
LVFLMVSFPLVFVPICIPLFSRHLCYVLWRGHFNYTRRRVQLQVRASHCAVNSKLLPLNPSSFQTSSSAPCSHTPSVCVPSFMSEIKFHTHTETQEKLHFILTPYFYRWQTRGLNVLHRIFRISAWLAYFSMRTRGTVPKNTV